MNRISATIVAVVVACALTASAQPGSPLRLVRTIGLPDVQGRIGHMAVDVKGQRVFIAARGNNSVEIVDLKSGKPIHRIAGLSGPQGIAYVPKENRILVANGGDGTAKLFNGTSFSLMSSINLGDDADNVRYSPALKVAYVGYGQRWNQHDRSCKAESCRHGETLCASCSVRGGEVRLTHIRQYTGGKRDIGH